MWITHSEGSRDLVQQTILEEVRRLLRDYHSYGEMDLLAATQSMLILLIILFFGIGHSPALAHPIDAQLLIEMWNVKHSLASTGLFLEEESNHTLPSWKEWAIVSAKRRTILALHHLEWAWSLRHGYPVLTCFELGPLPAPAAKYLWQMTHEKEWGRLYKDWLKLWADGSYKMVELFRINACKPSDDLDTRSELWLSEADEFGVMLMAEVNGIGIQY
ncbi:zn2 cys6 dna-binding [Trichoderma arundinaceum]|uniref:Zn2 cys6 dna-binding n=1 Tax=Trichoderma arundinaceum TaxID=490622 RepID=A0A395NMT7_TRIAR|nr:zn2 cys6 dna-binding [Trichoderma arundinaceum]